MPLVNINDRLAPGLLGLTFSWLCFPVQLMAESVFDVLCVADMYLLPGLKRLCGKALAQTLCKSNVVYMWKTAKLFQLSRLEDQCVEYMAKIIYQVSVPDLNWGLASKQKKA